MDRDRLVRAVSEVLEALGEDPSRPGLAATPDRVAAAYEELFSGYAADPAEVLEILPGEVVSGLILVKDVEVVSFCEHHLLPFMGRAAVAYLPGPDGRICGLSKLSRVVEVLSRRLQVQERLVAEIADAVQKALEPRGVFVWVEAEHMCMTLRGARKPGAKMVTVEARGVFEEPSERQAIMELIRS